MLNMDENLTSLHEAIVQRWLTASTCSYHMGAACRRAITCYWSLVGIVFCFFLSSRSTLFEYFWYSNGCVHLSYAEVRCNAWIFWVMKHPLSKKNQRPPIHIRVLPRWWHLSKTTDICEDNFISTRSEKISTRRVVGTMSSRAFGVCSKLVYFIVWYPTFT
jgi:hypothetical protein